MMLFSATVIHNRIIVAVFFVLNIENMRLILFLWLFAFQIGYSQNQDFTYFNKVYGTDTMNILSMVCKPLPNGDYFVLGGYTSLNRTNVQYIRKINEIGK